MRFLTRLCIVGPLVLIGTGVAQAKPRYGMAGCGLGSLVFGKSGGNAGQLFALSTNVTGTQTFGISSGTSNCASGDEMAVLRDQESFVAANLSTLQKELAQGGGDTVVGLSEVFGCSAGSTPLVAKKLVSDYERIFSAPGVWGVIDAAKESLKSDQSTATQCTHLS